MSVISKPGRQKLRQRHPQRDDGRTTMQCISVFIGIILFLAIVAMIHIVKYESGSVFQANHFLADDDDSRNSYYAKSSRQYGTDKKPQHLSVDKKSWLEIARKDEKANLILSGKVTLININTNTKHLRDESGYGGVTGIFCRLDWARYKADPSSIPMFRTLVDRACDRSQMFSYDLRTIVELATAMDNNPSPDYGTDVHVMQPGGFVFHESRCGSTLVANSLTAMEPDQHRVYSESSPPMQAIKACDDGWGGRCPPNRVTELLRDVVYLMGRTGDPDERRIFFKIQSAGTKYINAVAEAFPEVPWIFVYRDPVQVMASQLKRKVKRANCVMHLKRTKAAKDQAQFLASIGRSMQDLSPVEKCALHLSNLCDAAIKSISRSEGMGVGVNYENLVDKLITDVIPNHFKVPMTEERRDRIIEVSSHYSKGVYLRAGEWEGDSDRKDANASPEIKEASETFLYPSYKLLEN